MFKENTPVGAKIGILGKLFKEVVKELCNKNGINETYSKVIMMLSCCKQGVSQNEIVDNTYLKKSTISLTLKSMEQEGYITRKQCEEDYRKIIVQITDKGMELNQQIRQCYKAIEQVMINNLTSDELLLFNEILSKMKNNLELQKGENKC